MRRHEGSPIANRSGLTIDRAVITVDRMVTNTGSVQSTTPSVNRVPTVLTVLTLLGRAYLALVVGALAGLAVLSISAPDLAPQSAWVHQGIVTAFAVLLLLRLRRAVTGNVRALRASGIIAGVLVAVNVVEAQLPGLFPAWLRAMMLLTAVVLLGIVATVIRARVGR